MRVIFLDIDGCLTNSWSFRPGCPSGLQAVADPLCITALNRIIHTTGAAIVISSDWRKSLTNRGLARILLRWGVLGQFIGSTPVLPGMIRGEEILAWLRRHPRIKQFVILDDDRDMGPLEPHLVRTGFRKGLTEALADEAIAILKNQSLAVQTEFFA
jgi:hypothetical protein